jgi:uncharacterized repeat protein (TIGR01451 family)
MSTVRRAATFICLALVLQFAASAANYSYDSSGRLTRINYGAAGVVVYTYDSAGNLVTRQVLPPASDPILSIASSHTGTFAQGQANAIYTVSVTNSGAGPTVAPVTITDSLPPGITLVSISGTGWSCTGNTCTTANALSPAISYPAIIVTVNVAPNAPAQVTNEVSVSGGGSTVANGNDPTAIAPRTPQTITFAPLGDIPAGTTPFAVSATSTSGLPILFASTTPKVCTVSGNTVTILIAGGCSITASQAGNTTYAYAVMTQSFTVLFTDVAPTDFYYSATVAMAQKSITAGCGNNGFCPNDNVTRDEMAIFIVRAIYGNDNFTYTSAPYFTDVTPTTFGFKWIQKLKDLGITSGCTATTYCPLDVVARDQMAIFIIRARLGVGIAGANPTFTYPSTPYFTDAVAGNEFAYQWIQRMKLENITAGCSATTYCPSSPVTRGEMAIFIMRGAFNQYLPVGTPMITQISPAILTPGPTGTYTITGVNTNFVQGVTQLSPIPGVTTGTVTVNSPTSMTVQLTATASAVPQPYSILVITGSEQAVLPNGLLLQ